MDHIISIFKTISIKNGYEIYIVGGYIRNKLLGVKEDSYDIDFVFNGDIKVLKKSLFQYNINLFPISEENGIYRGFFNNISFDVCLIKGSTIEEDLCSRDFTINSIALKLIDNKIIDPFNGRENIKQRILTEVNYNSIVNDKIRILRAIRFKIKYGLHFNVSTETHIREESPYILQCKKERIFEEFMKIIENDFNGVAFETLDDYGVLKCLLPYIEGLKTIGKCKYHMTNALDHMKNSYKMYISFLKDQNIIKYTNIVNLNELIGDFKISTYMGFAVFVHDIGKYKSYKKVDDKITFIGHDLEGEKIISNFCTKLGFPNKAKDLILHCVKFHMYPLFLYKNNIKNNIFNIKKSYYKFFSTCGIYTPYIIILSFCDIYSTRLIYDKDNEKEDYKKFIENLLYEYSVFLNLLKDKVISGSEISNLTSLKGEALGLKIKEIQKLRYINNLKTKDDIIKFLEN